MKSSNLTNTSSKNYVEFTDNDFEFDGDLATENVIQLNMEKNQKHERHSVNRERDQFAFELPMYNTWTKLLENRYQQYTSWSKSCNSRNSRDQCERDNSTEQINSIKSTMRPRLKKSAIRCGWNSYWFAKSACLADQSQWSKAAKDLITFSQLLLETNDLDEADFLLLPFTGFINDIVYKLTQGRLKLGINLSPSLDNRTDINALLFYFLFQISLVIEQTSVKERSNIPLFSLLMANPISVNALIFTLVTAEVSLLQRIVLIDELFEFQNKAVGIQEARSVNYNKKQTITNPIVWSLLILPFFVSTVSAEASNTGQLTKSYADMTGLQLAEQTRSLQTRVFNLPERPDGLETKGKLQLQKNIAKILINESSFAYEKYLAFSDVLEIYGTKLQLFWPQENQQFNEALQTVVKHGTEIAKFVAKINLLNSYQLLTDAWTQELQIAVPESLNNDRLNLERDLQRIAPTILSDRDVFQSFYSLYNAVYDPSTHWAVRSYESVVIQNLGKTFAAQLKAIQARGNPEEDAPLIQDLLKAAVTIELVSRSVDNLQNRLIAYPELRSTEQRAIYAQVLEIVPTTAVRDIQRKLQRDYQIDVSINDLLDTVSEYNVLARGRLMTNVIDELVQDNLALQAEARRLDSERKVLESEATLTREFQTQLQNIHNTHLNTSQITSLLIYGALATGGITSLIFVSLYTTRLLFSRSPTLQPIVQAAQAQIAQTSLTICAAEFRVGDKVRRRQGPLSTVYIIRRIEPQSCVAIVAELINLQGTNTKGEFRRDLTTGEYVLDSRGKRIKDEILTTLLYSQIESV